MAVQLRQSLAVGNGLVLFMNRVTRSSGTVTEIRFKNGAARPPMARAASAAMMRLMPAGTLCACCGSADIEPSGGWIGGSWYLCRDCRGLLMNADYEIDGRWVGETVLVCDVHGNNTLASS